MSLSLLLAAHRGDKVVVTELSMDSTRLETATPPLLRLFSLLFLCFRWGICRLSPFEPRGVSSISLSCLSGGDKEEERETTPLASFLGEDYRNSSILSFSRVEIVLCPTSRSKILCRFLSLLKTRKRSEGLDGWRETERVVALRRYSAIEALNQKRFGQRSNSLLPLVISRRRRGRPLKRRKQAIPLRARASRRWPTKAGAPP